MDDSRPTLVLAGASGFVGQALARVLRGRFRLVGLSRRARAADGTFDELRRCNLFNLREADEGLRGADYAVYLVHSMMPSARLTQGSFADLDLICADNFARAAHRAGVRQIVYLGGLIPEDDDGHELSQHLQSRLEVERTLARYGTPLTTLRAGIILGAGGSSFRILTALVRRLPAMVLPAWTGTPTQPVALDDVVALLAFALGEPRCFGRSFDIGVPEPLSYRALMELVAELSGRRLPALPVPFMSPGLSRLWVSLVTGAPKALVAPLVESLRHPMVTRDHELARLAGRPPMSVRAALTQALADEARQGRRAPRAFMGARAGATATPGRLVRSVQRMRLPEGRDAEWAAAEYARWLPHAMRGLIHADVAMVDGKRTVRFYLTLFQLELLVLSHAPARSSPDRQLYFVSGGLLSRAGQHGRFELRQLLDGRTLVTAIHDYEPRLPWPVYLVSQALCHLLVMHAFRRHLLDSAGAPHPHRAPPRRDLERVPNQAV